MSWGLEVSPLPKMQGQHAGNGHRAYRLRPLNPPRFLTCLPPSGPIAIHHIYYVWYLMHCILVLLQEPKKLFIPYWERPGTTIAGDLCLDLGTRELMLNFLLKLSDF